MFFYGMLEEHRAIVVQSLCSSGLSSQINKDAQILPVCQSYILYESPDSTVLQQHTALAALASAATLRKMLTSTKLQFAILFTNLVLCPSYILLCTFSVPLKAAALPSKLAAVFFQAHQGKERKSSAAAEAIQKSLKNR